MNIMSTQRRKSLKGFAAVCFAVICLSGFPGCGGIGASEGVAAKAYTITLEGAPTEPGVITYLGFEMNVYNDVASNPCGDCEDQPVSVYIGTPAETITAAIKQAIEIDFPNGDWSVVDLDGKSVIVTAAEGAMPEEPAPPAAPAGLDIKGGYTKAVSGGRSGVGNASGVPDNPQRIAAVYGPSYEALTLLGAEELIVARADVQTENFPWAAEVYKQIDTLPVLEDVHAAVNTEELLTHKPDLVYSFPRPNEIALLDKAGIGYIPGRTTRSLDDVKRLLAEFASPLGEDAGKRAEAYAAWFDERLAFVRERTGALGEADRKTVYYAGTDILTTYGDQSDIIEVIETAGGVAVTKELSGGNRINTDAEKLAAWNPEYIFIDHCGMSGSEGGTADKVAEAAYANPKYVGIQAIKNRNVIMTPSGVFYWDMGVQKILLVEYMAKTLHPELFEDLDIAAEIQEFYTLFFDCPLTYEQAEQILNRQAPQ